MYQFTNLLQGFPQTKFTLPLLSSAVVTRPRLLAQLEHSVRRHRLTLISAPAGSGKTTLLATLPQVLPDLPFTWLALDEQDNDPVNFIIGLAGAISRLNPRYAEAIKPLLDNPGEVDRDGGLRSIGLLINEILLNLPQPFALILDDLHSITNSKLYQLLDYFLERLPPQVHLVIATRYDPPLALARLRVRSQLAELRLDELRFNAEEAALFFNQLMGLALSSSDLEALLQHTEGWAAALRLLANSLNSYKSPGNPGQAQAALLAGLDESKEQLFDYLADEVLQHQSLVERTFLLETSILAELTPDLCQEVSGRGDAGELLERLSRRNLFLLAVDKKSQTYRYHDLFRDFLQRKLKQELPHALPILHKCAAHFLSKDLPASAIRHFLAGEWWEAAAQTIEEIGDSWLRQGKLLTLQNWIAQLPSSIISQHPRLKYYQGFCALRQGRLDEARVRLEEAWQGAEAQPGTQREQGETLMMLAFCCFSQTDFEYGNRYLDQAQKLSLSFKNQVQLWISRAYQAAYNQEWKSFEETCRLALQLTLESDDLEAYYEIALQMHHNVNYVGITIDIFEEYCKIVVERFSGKNSFIEAAARLQLAFIELMRGNFDSSVEAFKQANKIGGQTDLTGHVEFDLIIVVLLQQYWQGDYAGLEESYARFMPHLASPLAKPWLPSYVSNRALLKYYQGLIEEANQLYRQARRLVYPQMRPDNEVGLLITQAFLDLEAGRTLEAEQALTRAKEMQHKLLLSFSSGTVAVLLAHFYLLTGRSAQALAELGPLLAECKARNMPGLILKQGPAVAGPLLKLAIESGVQPRYAAELLHLIPFTSHEIKPHAIKIAGGAESLTAREIEVVQLLTARATNREIAEQLVISEETVKSHVKRILQKMGLTSRHEVASHARELGLL